MFNSLSPAASLIGFKTYFAVEALINDHREGLLAHAANSRSTDTFSPHFKRIMFLIANSVARFMISESTQAFNDRMIRRDTCSVMQIAKT